ncbi:restriction endonuclease subunit S [Sphingobium sp. DEHP117]|nr:restriction endonuclease subunit S [Sphingobium sp. DEHP117]MDQ4419507.1 restriction endonuclease subunit S [Sphingobium sp. DEHP117]
MQQFFPAPGETTPRLRFPEFQGAGDWEEQALGNLLEFPPNYGANAPSAPYSPDLPTYLRITDISEDGRFIRESRMSVEVEATPDNSMQAGDIALTRTGASVGKSYLHKEAEGPLVFAGFLIRIRPNSNLIIPEFVSQFFNSYRYWSWVEKTSTRSGQPGLNSTEFSALLIPLPKNNQGKGIQEQRRIADSLSSIDALIVSQSDRINAIKTHKQGLMHQLFPVASEVQV